MDIHPKRAIAYERALQHQRQKSEAERHSLESQIRTLKEDAAFLKELVVREDIPYRVRQWMQEYDLFIPECFWCFEHDEWLVELDGLFPNHMEHCQCESCME